MMALQERLQCIKDAISWRVSEDGFWAILVFHVPLLFSVTLHVFDVVSDILLAIQHHNEGDFLWSEATTALIAIPWFIHLTIAFLFWNNRYVPKCYMYITLFISCSCCEFYCIKLYIGAEIIVTYMLIIFFTFTFAEKTKSISSVSSSPSSIFCPSLFFSSPPNHSGVENRQERRSRNPLLNFSV